jgi:hypothetical protein
MWRKGRDKQAQRQGLVILSAVYGDMKVHERGANWAEESASSEDDDADLPPPYLDVGIPNVYSKPKINYSQLWSTDSMFKHKYSQM